MLANLRGYETNVVKTRIIELARQIGAISEKDGATIMALAGKLEQWQNRARP